MNLCTRCTETRKAVQWLMLPVCFTIMWICIIVTQTDYMTGTYSRIYAKYYTGPMCNMTHLHINDTDETLLDLCSFPNASMDTNITAMLDTFDPENFPKFEFLDNYRSPCWYESIPDDYHSTYYSLNKSYRSDMLQRSFDRILPVYEERIKTGQNWRLRCLPLVYIIGVEKCGTTDLYHTIAKHPSFAAGADKEVDYWGNNIWTRLNTFDKFLDLFDEAAESIRNTTVKVHRDGKDIEYHDKFTVDSSVRTWIYAGGNAKTKANQHRYSHHYMPALPMKKLTPNFDLKIILIIRNPTERLFSSYIFFNTWVRKPKHKISAEIFHQHVLYSIELFEKCTRTRLLDDCAFDRTVSKDVEAVNLFTGIYYAYIKHWKVVYPNMRVIRMEDYKERKDSVIGEVFDYIGLEPVTLKQKKKIVNKGPKKPFEMFNQTEEILDNFYRPYNQMLADLMEDSKFLYS